MLRLPRRIVPLITASVLCLSSIATAQTPTAAHVEAIRFWSFGDVTRVAVQTQGDYKLQSDQIQNPARVYFDLTGLRPPASKHKGVQSIHVADRLVKEIRVAEVSPGKTRIVFDLENGAVEVVSSQLVNPDRLMIEFRPKGTSLRALSLAHSVTESLHIDLNTDGDLAPLSPVSSENAATVPASTLNAPLEDVSPKHLPSLAEPAKVQPMPPPPAVKFSSVPHSATLMPPPAASTVMPPLTAVTPAVTAIVPPPRAKTSASVPVRKDTIAAAKTDNTGERSLVRVFGLKLGRVVIDAGHGGHDTGTIGPNGLMEKDLVLDVALRLGRLITDQLGAEVIYTRPDDTFIPLEERTKVANAQKADLFISVHANSSPEPSATGVETYYFNFTSDKTGLDLATRENAASGSSISDLSDLLHKAVLQTKLEESRDFAHQVQNSLWGMSVKMNTRSRDRGIRQAPFVVLIGATMPSILAEIGFVSNPHDEKLMGRSDQRQKIADALFKGVSQYASSLSHMQMARAAGAQ